MIFQDEILSILKNHVNPVSTSSHPLTICYHNGRG
jgi:hypothetical protein